MPLYPADRLYGNFPELGMQVNCPCGWRGARVNLHYGDTVELMHPKNKGKVFADDEESQRNAHRTFYEACPRCGRWHYAHNKSLQAPK